MVDLRTTLARRRFLGVSAAAVATLSLPGRSFAEELAETPRMTEGPFYPDHLPLDTDNDLIIVNEKLTSAIGEVTHLTGRVLTSSGSPVRNATVEIWQVDGKGVYLHSQSGGGERDGNFQGFGRFLTSSKGEFYFRTVKPVPYPGRTPHIHVIVKQGDRELLCSQFFIKGDPRNERDGVFRNIADPKLQALVTSEFAPLPGSTTGELMASYDIVLGKTPAEA